MRLDKSDHRPLVLWATDCAAHVLRCFEEKYPEDNRPREAVKTGRAWARSEIPLNKARLAALGAHAAARDAVRDADQTAACAAARPAVPIDAAAATAKERDWQYRHLPDDFRPVAYSARTND